MARTKRCPRKQVKKEVESEHSDEMEQSDAEQERANAARASTAIPEAREAAGPVEDNARAQPGGGISTRGDRLLPSKCVSDYFADPNLFNIEFGICIHTLKMNKDPESGLFKLPDDVKGLFVNLCRLYMIMREEGIYEHDWKIFNILVTQVLNWPNLNDHLVKWSMKTPFQASVEALIHKQKSRVRSGFLSNPIEIGIKYIASSDGQALIGNIRDRPADVRFADIEIPASLKKLAHEQSTIEVMFKDCLFLMEHDQIYNEEKTFKTVEESLLNGYVLFQSHQNLRFLIIGMAKKAAMAFSSLEMLVFTSKAFRAECGETLSKFRTQDETSKHWLKLEKACAKHAYVNQDPKPSMPALEAKRRPRSKSVKQEEEEDDFEDEAGMDDASTYEY